MKGVVCAGEANCFLEVSSVVQAYVASTQGGSSRLDLCTKNTQNVCKSVVCLQSKFFAVTLIVPLLNSVIKNRDGP